MPQQGRYKTLPQIFFSLTLAGDPESSTSLIETQAGSINPSTSNLNAHDDATGALENGTSFFCLTFVGDLESSTSLIEAQAGPSNPSTSDLTSTPVTDVAVPSAVVTAVQELLKEGLRPLDKRTSDPVDFSSEA
jgi:hypothetical protein